jgi:hypothetical protein
MSLMSCLVIHKIMSSNTTFICSLKEGILPVILQITGTLITILFSWLDMYRKDIHIPLCNQMLSLIAASFRLLLSIMLATSAVNTQSPFLTTAVSLFRSGALINVPQVCQGVIINTRLDCKHMY